VLIPQKPLARTAVAPG